MNFFKLGAATDPTYRATRDGVDEHLVKGREYIERLWHEVAPYLDSDAANKATRDLASVFWELQLAYTVKSDGKCLVPRRSLAYKNNKGPDLFAKDDSGVWIEAVVVGCGDGADALQRPEHGKAYNYNPDGVVLRFRHVIKDKSAKLQSYIADGIIKPSQATVIAISGISLYSGCGSPPEIVRAVYPVNNLVFEINPETMAVVGSHVEYRNRVKKLQGAEVETDIFMNPQYSHISAVLYGEACWVYPANPPGAEFKLVHNSMATTPLPYGWFPGVEYWWREGERHWHLESRRRE